MHIYQIEDDIKTRKIIIAIVFAIGAAYFLSLFLRSFPTLSLWWIDYPSVLGFYGIFIWLFDHYIWKTNFVQKWSWLYVPNLSGVWNGEIKTSYNEFNQAVDCKLTIHQTGSRISILLTTENSISHSVHAAILRSERVGGFELMYNFINEPKADSKSTMNIHYGTAWLEISDTYCDGEYFTGRGRSTFGRMKLYRE